MYAIFKHKQENFTVLNDEQTIEDAKRFCNDYNEGKKVVDEDNENNYRLEIREVHPDGNLEMVYATDYYEE